MFLTEQGPDDTASHAELRLNASPLDSSWALAGSHPRTEGPGEEWGHRSKCLLKEMVIMALLCFGEEISGFTGSPNPRKSDGFLASEPPPVCHISDSHTSFFSLSTCSLSYLL